MASPTRQPQILSEGAGIALGSVLSRLVNAPKPRSGKRPRGTVEGKRSGAAPVILVDNEQVREELVKETEERRKVKEARRAREGFESNGLVIPDAATGAALERELLVTATKGAVALFNAVRNAQKGGGRTGSGGEGRGQAVSKESFMSMMKAGVVSRSEVAKTDRRGDKSSEEEGEEDEEDSDTRGGGAKWLRDGYLTKGSTKLKHWEKEGTSDEGSSEDEEEDEGKTKEEESS